MVAREEISSWTERKAGGKGGKDAETAWKGGWDAGRDGVDSGPTETNVERREHTRKMEKRTQISD
jgi:hypothetical protein